MGTRERLLRAAAAVVRRGGPQALTLDAVAAQAGVSKGGLLYHFPSKHALLDALASWWWERFEEEVEAADDGAPGGWLRAYVRACDVAGMLEEERATELGLVAAIAAEPERLELVRERYRTWQERTVASGPDPVAATIVRLAADGLWFADVFDLAAPAGELRAAVLARLEELASG
jgi:AcrR family transcriptional regulator